MAGLELCATETGPKAAECVESGRSRTDTELSAQATLAGLPGYDLWLWVALVGRGQLTGGRYRQWANDDPCAARKGSQGSLCAISSLDTGEVALVLE